MVKIAPKNPYLLFCRILLRQFRESIRPYLKHLPKDCLKGAWTHKTTFGTWECHLPKVGYYWYGSAGYAAEAKHNAFEAYVKEALPPKIYKEYSENC
jgi:hypothetical protein